MNRSRGFLLLLICSLVLAQPWVFADEAADYQAALDAANAQRDDLWGKIQWAEQEANSILYELSVVDWELGWTENQLAQLAEQKAVAEQNIQLSNAQLEELNQKITSQNQVSKQRLRSLYENGNISYLEVFFGSTSFSQFLTQFEQITQIFQKDLQVLEAQRKLKDELEIANQQLKANVQYLASLENQAQVREAELAVKRVERNEIMSSILGQKESWQQAYDELQNESVRLESVIRDLQSQNQGPSYGTGVYLWPVPSTRFTTDEFGPRDLFGSYNMHNGLDIAGSYGSAIVAADGGTVISATYGYNGGYGNMVMIDHGDGIVTLYAHCSSLAVNSGQVVDRGDVIAYIGDTGLSFGAHLHIEVRVNGVPVNPRDYIGW